MTTRSKRRGRVKTLAQLAERLEEMGLGGIAKAATEELTTSRIEIWLDAKDHVPFVTGTLKSSVKQGGRELFHRVSAGSRKVKYAGIIERFQPFLEPAADREAPKLQARLGKRIEEILNNG